MKIIFILLCLPFTLAMLFIIFESIIIAQVYFDSFSAQILLYELVNIIILITFWVLIFISAKFLKKFVIFLFCVVLLLIIPKIPDAVTVWDYDTCVDYGICAEGLYIKLGSGKKEIVNEENCRKYNKVWENGECYVRVKRSKDF